MSTRQYNHYQLHDGLHYSNRHYYHYNFEFFFDIRKRLNVSSIEKQIEVFYSSLLSQAKVVIGSFCISRCILTIGKEHSHHCYMNVTWVELPKLDLTVVHQFWATVRLNITRFFYVGFTVIAT